MTVAYNSKTGALFKKCPCLFFGIVFVFSGVRRKDLEEIIADKGGKIASGVSAKITHLVVKDTNSGSSKVVKAKDLGKEVITVEQLEELLK